MSLPIEHPAEPQFDRPQTPPATPPLPRWEKRGHIFTRLGGQFFQSHTTRPIPYLIDSDCLRIFLFSRCSNDTMHPTFLDVDPATPCRILRICEQPIMPLGRPGTFDDSGISPGSLIECEGRTLVYYTGWKRRRHVNFELSIGVAELHDDGRLMKRLFDGPLLGQDRAHPILTGGPFVLRDGARYRMWYCSGLRWDSHPHGCEPIYTVFHAHSHNGLDWVPECRPLLPPAFDGEVITAPWVVRHASGWLMWYSYRGSNSPEAKRYRIGVATSIDGEHWVRRDTEAGIVRSTEGWDSEMACYPSLYEHDGRAIMLYCGNHVGRGGIGWAIARDPCAEQEDHIR
jgi:hypothetical protein